MVWLQNQGRGKIGWQPSQWQWLWCRRLGNGFQTAQVVAGRADTGVWWWCAECNHAVLAARAFSQIWEVEWQADLRTFRWRSLPYDSWCCKHVCHPLGLVHQNEKDPTKAASISMAASNLPGAPLHCFGQYEGRDRRVGLALCQQMSRTLVEGFCGASGLRCTALQRSVWGRNWAKGSRVDVWIQGDAAWYQVSRSRIFADICICITWVCYQKGVPRILPRNILSQTMAFLGTDFSQPGWSTFRCGAAATGPLLLWRPIESGHLLAVPHQDLDGWVVSSARFISMSFHVDMVDVCRLIYIFSSLVLDSVSHLSHLLQSWYLNYLTISIQTFPFIISCLHFFSLSCSAVLIRCFHDLLQWFYLPAQPRAGWK